ncbi:hypothetical protein MKZ87_13915 [Pseudomonas sp. MCal1]|uniref:hypothetical protein n=1 Tax=Pseudomonas sp. MCal1 TaxID=2919887 RepID=UPI002250B2E2|nr:hypothetical protein [Pseudomonas sp. MCal1]MCX4218736.1 hypothetical protein [Pseudomonas sp. MCal1]
MNTHDYSLAELRDTLTLLALASSIVANPNVPQPMARVVAVMSQHTAMAWAELLDDLIAAQGGVQ